MSEDVDGDEIRRLEKEVAKLKAEIKAIKGIANLEAFLKTDNAERQEIWDAARADYVPTVFSEPPYEPLYKILTEYDKAKHEK